MLQEHGVADAAPLGLPRPPLGLPRLGRMQVGCRTLPRHMCGICVDGATSPLLLVINGNKGGCNPFQLHLSILHHLPLFSLHLLLTFSHHQQLLDVALHHLGFMQLCSLDPSYDLFDMRMIIVCREVFQQESHHFNGPWCIFL
eukprot:TRINITY_DN57730_c0_g1_i1.p2 TRINITY_DN57730_c0_g1~~TRINITY_DN57730_c0_g1_i1.p2  ORF type:complete len:143 (-),score=10.96 TRINITY_DN57730_c0_g1_i1:46-474(-)